MGRKKKVKNEISLTPLEQQALQQQYVDELDNDPKYSLKADPEHIYNMCEEQKRFIEYYISFKSISTAADFAGIPIETAKSYFIDMNSQSEIRRINSALYHRQFTTKMMDLDEIGGYLTSLIKDEYVPYNDRLTSAEKIAVTKQITEIIKLKQSAFNNPVNVMSIDIDTEIRNLSLSTIKSLLAQKKLNVIENTNFSEKQVVDDTLTPEETELLSTLPAKQLLEMIEATNLEEDKHNGN